ncbi:MAG: glycosyltransferase [Desulfobacterales bacterium]|jgi:glycosyltransferase involved in cell wall biosynthesis|nr:glycosyltransferase [Desulfobacterales bacterium]
MDHRPLVSVIIPVFNGAAYIASAIRSVLAQKFRDFELIVVDNRSDDGTVEIVRRFDDPRIRLHAEAVHLSIYENFNRAAACARGEFLKFLCADDELAPAHLSTLLPVLQAQPGVSLATSSRLRIDERGRPAGVLLFPHRRGLIGAGDCYRYVAEFGNFIGEPTATLMRKADFDRHQGFSPRYRQVGDLDLWCRLLSEGCLHYHPEALARIRSHCKQLTRLHSRQPEIWIRDEILFFQRLTPLFLNVELPGIARKRLLKLFTARMLRTGIMSYAGSPRQLVRAAGHLANLLPRSAVLAGVFENGRKIAALAGRPILRGVKRAAPGNGTSQRAPG